jgi:LacI family transcriptional regulator
MNNDILSHLPKAVRIKEEIKKQLSSGALGKVNDEFMSVRKLAEFADVSLVTAQRIMTMLKEDGVISLENGSHIISRLPATDNSKSQRAIRNLIGMLVTNIENPFFAALAREMEEAAREASMQLMIASSNYDVTREAQALEMFNKAGVAGIISCPCIDKNVHKLYSNLEIPFVFMGRKLKEIKSDSVLVDNFNATKLVADHFISGGYENFGYFGLEQLENDQRLNGFNYELEKNGYRLPEENILKTNDLSYANITDEITGFLKNIPKPAAIFCFHDLLALLLSKACASMNLSVPDDIAIAGFDNLPFTSKTTPTLTTVGYPLRTMARLALNRLLEKIKQGSTMSGEMVNLSVEPKFFARQSSSKEPEKSELKVISNDIIYQAS